MATNIGTPTQKVETVYTKRVVADTVEADNVVGYLPTSGGAMTGDIRRPDDASQLSIHGGTTTNHGASLFLVGQDDANNSGVFNLTARARGATSNLLGNPNGSLLWCGNPVATTNKLSMPTNQSIDISSDMYTPVAESSYDGQFQAPTDGYLIVACNCTGYIFFSRNGAGTSRFVSDGYWAIGEVPLSKGQIVGIELRGVIGATGTKFVYAQSAT